MNSHYKLAKGSQVRQEDFGLLFYTKSGPRLYFLSSGDLIGPGFFTGEFTLNQWVKNNSGREAMYNQVLAKLNKELEGLCDKGVLLGF